MRGLQYALLTLAMVTSALAMGCGGAQSADRCAGAGKFLPQLAGVAEFACNALGGDSGKCARARQALDVASDLCAL